MFPLLPSCELESASGKPALLIANPAKLNLYFNVLSKRKDGFHEIESIMNAIDLWDLLYIELAPELEEDELKISGIGIRQEAGPMPKVANNLVCKAAELMRQKLGEIPSLRFHLYKRIPAGAGLGGGSGNAVAAMVGIARILAKEEWLDPARLFPLASALGSDCPFFLYSSLQHAQGRGEKLSEVRARTKEAQTRPDLMTDDEGLNSKPQVVLVLPKQAVSTAKAFAQLSFDLTMARPSYSFNASLFKIPDDWSQLLFNRLQDSVTNTYPPLAQLAAGLENICQENASLKLSSCMTGSGSAFFILAKRMDAAADAAVRAQRLLNIIQFEGSPSALSPDLGDLEVSFRAHAPSVNSPSFDLGELHLSNGQGGQETLSFACIQQKVLCQLHDGAVNDGAVNDGAVNDGAVNDGAVNDGAVNEGAVNEQTSQSVAKVRDQELALLRSVSAGVVVVRSL